VNLRCCGTCELVTPALRWQCVFMVGSVQRSDEERCIAEVQGQMGARSTGQKLRRLWAKKSCSNDPSAVGNVEYVRARNLRSASVVDEIASLSVAVTGALEIEFQQHRRCVRGVTRRKTAVH